MNGALSGLKVIDLTQMLAGPFCTQMLADHGAEVIKIEPPTGDTTRQAGPFRSDDELRAFGGYFQSVNRNKRSLVLDLKQDAAKAVLLRLVESADVLVENFRAGVMDRLGLSYEALSARNPRLVYAAIRGFGDPRSGASPYVDWPAYDVVAQAMGGLMGITGPGPQSPMKCGPGVGDLVPAMFAAFGVLAAVYRVREGGKGQFVDVGMADSVLALCERLIYQHSYQDRIPHPEGNRHPLLCPFGLFRAKDGWVSIACPADPFWRALVTAMGHPELADDERYAKSTERVSRSDEVIRLVEAFTVARTKSELGELLGGVIPFGPVQDAQDILNDAHFRARNMLVEVEQPGSQSPVRIAGVPIKLSSTPGGIRRRAPLLGEDSEEILSAHGFAAAEIAVLRASKAVA